MPEEPLDSAAFRLLRAASRTYVEVCHRVVAPGPSTVPAEGPAIVAPNHTASLDPLVVQSLVGRPIIWMMAAEYARIPLTGWFWRATRVIPVARDGHDSAAFRAALRVLRSGGVLGLFPEGRIETEHRLLPLQAGIIQLAARANAPIVPVWLDGTQRRRDMLSVLLLPNEVTVAFGKPLPSDLPSLLPDLENALFGLQRATQAQEE